MSNQNISKELLDILTCPNCRFPLENLQNKALLCKNCLNKYEFLESGQIDLRLKNPKLLSLDFNLDLRSADNFTSPKAFLQENQHPEVLFGDSEIPHHLSKELLSYFPKAQSNNEFVLDLGCGDALHRAVCDRTGFNYVGMDYSHPKAPILGDAHALPFRDESFGFVLSIAVLEHIQYPFVMIKEASRVMRKNGVLIGTVSFQEPFHGNSFYHHTHLGLSNLLSFGGFKIIELAPNKGWQVFNAQSRMAAWAIFPSVPSNLSRMIIKFPQVLSNAWLRLIEIYKKKAFKESRAFINAGSFSFVARK